MTLFRKSNANTSALRGDDSARDQIVRMIGNDAQTDGCLVARRQIDKANDAPMGMPLANCQRSKVLVQSYQNAAFAIGVRQNSLIAGIMIPIA